MPWRWVHCMLVGVRPLSSLLAVRQYPVHLSKECVEVEVYDVGYRDAALDETYVGTSWVRGLDVLGV